MEGNFEKIKHFFKRGVYFTGMPATGIFWLFCRLPVAHAQYLDLRKSSMSSVLLKRCAVHPVPFSILQSVFLGCKKSHN